jgi:phytoene dehydrogenase-like protein
VKSGYDAVVVGAGPNGLSAAIALAQAGCSVLVCEAAHAPGGGVRSAELTLPGFVHDLCSAVHPMAIASPFFQSLPLAAHGVEWVHPDLPLAHPLDSGDAAVLDRSVRRTSQSLGADGAAYGRLIGPFVERWTDLVGDALGPLAMPRHPLLMARLGAAGALPASVLATLVFRTEAGRALFAGLAAHGVMPLNAPFTSAIGLMLQAAGHAGGWPFPRGGAQRLTDALVACFESLGGELALGQRVDSIDALPRASMILCDVPPREMLRIAGHRLPPSYARRLSEYRHGPGAFKIDWALDGAIPWRAEACRRAGVVHVGGTLDEIADAERITANGGHPPHPFVLVAQQSLFDPARAPAGRQAVWGYCHVPNGSTVDMTGAIEAQIERFAPGFRERILARHTMTTADLEAHNRNLVGGDFSGGANTALQLFWRPTAGTYRTPVKGLYFCSASTPPGGGVHGMCGVHAARAALRDRGRVELQGAGFAHSGE